MLHADITKTYISSIQAMWRMGPWGETTVKKLPTTYDVATKTGFDSTIGAFFRNNKKIPYGLHVQVSRCGYRAKKMKP